MIASNPMKRRSFFQFLGGVATVVPVVAARASEENDGQALVLKPRSEGLTTVDASWLRYKGFDIKWTGWKEAQNSESICGQWIARKINRESFEVKGLQYPMEGIVASFPGATTFFGMGSVFFTSYEKDQYDLLGGKYLTSISTVDQKRMGQEYALDSIKDFIDDYHRNFKL